MKKAMRFFHGTQSAYHFLTEDSEQEISSLRKLGVEPFYYNELIYQNASRVVELSLE
jgi:hypothetical protein